MQSQLKNNINIDLTHKKTTLAFRQLIQTSIKHWLSNTKDTQKDLERLQKQTNKKNPNKQKPSRFFKKIWFLDSSYD